MAKFETKFNAFIKAIEKDGTLKLTDELIDVLRLCLLSAKFNTMVSNIPNQKKKKLNGYNLYMKERMSVLKETVGDSNKRMSQISEEWNALSDETKEEWKTKANTLSDKSDSATDTVKKQSKRPKWSGYQLFVSEKMNSVKELKSKERMSAIGKLWKSLTEEQKAEYKTKATEKNITKEEPIKEEPKKEEVKEEPKKEEVKEEPIKEEPKKEEPKKDEVKKGDRKKKK